MPENAEPRKQSFLHGAAILAAAVILVKVIGALFKIPLINIIGKNGYAHFFVAYNIYSLLITVSTAGLPVALSKMISEAETLGRRNQIKRIARVATTTLVVLGVVFTLFMALCARWLADRMADSLAWHSILALAPSVLFVCIMSSYRGYFQGHSNMTPTAVSQIIEALCKLVIGLGLAWLVMRAGKGVEIGSAAAIIGVTAGSVLACLYMVRMRLKYRGVYSSGASDVPERSRVILRRFLLLAIPITLSASIMSIVSLIDNAIVLNRLQEVLGYTEDAAADLYGIYGSAQALFNLPVTLITPLTASVIPAISEALAMGGRKLARRTSESGMRMAALISLPCAFGLFVLAYPILALVYRSDLTIAAQGEILLRILAPSVVANSFVLITNAVLQSYGEVRLPMLSMLCGGVVKIILNYILVAVPSLNIAGAPIGTLACFVVIVVMNLIFIARRIPEKPRYSRVFVRPLIASVFTGAAAWGVFGIASRVFDTESGIGMLISCGAAIAVAVVVYLVLAVLLNAITKSDAALLPKGDKIIKFLRLR